MRIKELRKERHMTQKELAKAIGVDTSIISKFENGTLTPSLSRIKEISRVLDAPVDYLLSVEDQEVLVEIEPQPDQSQAAKRMIVYVSELERISVINQLDEIGIAVVDDVIQSQLKRCRNKDVIVDTTLQETNPPIDATLLFCNPATNKKAEKYANLKELKRKTFLSCADIQLLLAARGFNHLISISDLVQIFQGRLEPGAQLYTALKQLLEKSLLY